MATDDSRLDLIRPYVLGYVEGVLWIIAGLLISGLPNRALNLIEQCDVLVARFPHLRVPDLVVGLVILIIGVIFPYCVSITLRPFSALLVNILLAIQRQVSKTARQKKAWMVADQGIRDRVGINTRISPYFGLLTLRTVQPEVAMDLRHSYQDLVFRARSVLPISIILSSLIASIVGDPGWPAETKIFAISVGAFIFMFNMWSTNRNWDEFHEDLGASVLLFLIGPQKEVHTLTAKHQAESAEPKEQQTRPEDAHLKL